MLFQQPFVLLNSAVFDMNHCQLDSHLHCSHPVTTIICCSGSILLKGKGCLLLTQLPTKTGVASGNEDKMHYFQVCVNYVLILTYTHTQKNIVLLVCVQGTVLNKEHLKYCFLGICVNSWKMTNWALR